MRYCTSKQIYNCGKDFANEAKKSSWSNLLSFPQKQSLYLNDIYFKGTASIYPIYKYLHLVWNLRGTCTFDTGDHRRKCNVKSQIYLKLGSIEISRKNWVRHEIFWAFNTNKSFLFLTCIANSKYSPYSTFRQEMTFSLFTKPHPNTRRVGRIRTSYANPRQTFASRKW